MPQIRISKSSVDALRPDAKDVLYWDEQLKGFGLKVTPKGRKTYVCQYRADSGVGLSKRLSIGTHGALTAELARVEAKKILGQVANGRDPASEKQKKRKQLTVATLCDLYLAQGCGLKKLSTIATDKGRIERHIKPLLGKKKVPDVKRSDIKRFLQDVAAGKTSADIKTGKFGRAIVKGGKGTASRTVGLLGGIFTFALDEGLIEVNPVRGVKRFTDKRK